MKPPSERPPRTPAEMLKRTSEQKRYTAWLENLRAAADNGSKAAAHQLERHLLEQAMQQKFSRKVMLR